MANSGANSNGCQVDEKITKHSGYPQWRFASLVDPGTFL
jgi:hypothetical protein